MVDALPTRGRFFLISMSSGKYWQLNLWWLMAATRMMESLKNLKTMMTRTQLVESHESRALGNAGHGGFAIMSGFLLSDAQSSP